MKRSINTMKKFLFLSLPALLVQAVVMAQDSTTTAVQTTQTKTATETTWYAQPWVWVAGGAVVLLILIGLFRSGRSNTTSSDRVTVTKTVERDVDN